MPQALAFHGTIIHSKSISQVEILEDALIVVEKAGRIIHLETQIQASELSTKLKSLNLSSPPTIHRLRQSEFLIPGFVDTHNHAPQWEQRGLGQGMQIPDWLDQITFKNESLFADTNHAQRVYDKCVSGMLKQGATTTSFYATLHPSTKILADTCIRHGQRALIGKCNMDRNSPSYYIEPSAEESIRATEDVIAHIRQIDPKGEMVRPVLTPRFAISCTDALLTGIGRLVEKHPTLPIQTHFNESQSEIDFSLNVCFPQFTNEVQLYSHYNLLTSRTILAHCCHMTPSEISALKHLDCGIAHCPIANTTVGGGFMAAPIRAFLDDGIEKIGLGTDSGGGFSTSILDAMRQALIVSNAREMLTGGKEKALSIDEVFYMATCGGAKVCGLDDKVGRFEVGKEFDAILVRNGEAIEEEEAAEEVGQGVGSVDFGVMTPIVDGDSRRTILEKFIMSGDDRNLVKVWIKGRQVKGQQG